MRIRLLLVIIIVTGLLPAFGQFDPDMSRTSIKKVQKKIDIHFPNQHLKFIEIEPKVESISAVDTIILHGKIYKLFSDSMFVGVLVLSKSQGRFD